MQTVLFLCSGNTCRSPMAQMILQHKIQQEKLTDKMEVVSAGVHAYPGMPMSRGAKNALEKLGIDTDNHLSKMLTDALIDEADLILTMTQGHMAVVSNDYPSIKEKLHTLSGFCDEAFDIQDPFGQSDEQYFKCAKQLEALIDNVFSKIIFNLGDEKV